jgi:hypothetical protein
VLLCIPDEACHEISARTPKKYRQFNERFPKLGAAWETLQEAEKEGPLDERLRWERNPGRIDAPRGSSHVIVRRLIANFDGLSEGACGLVNSQPVLIHPLNYAKATLFL